MPDTAGPESGGSATLGVCAGTIGVVEQARKLADDLNLTFQADASPRSGLVLRLGPDMLSLEDCRQRPCVRVAVDFLSGETAYRLRHAFASRQPLARALGFRRQDPFSVIDATAGFGRDAMLLARLGCHVTLLERSPVVFALLQDGVRRAVSSDWLGPVIRERLRLFCTDARSWLAMRSDEYPGPDAVYLDPMFPERTKSSLVRKEMRALQALLGRESDADALLPAARSCATRRVVVKRPPGAPSLGGNRPDLVFEGKRARFDVYLANRESGRSGPE